MEEIRSIDVITEVDVAAVTPDAGYVQLQVFEEVDHDLAKSCMNDASCTNVATIAACASSASNRSSYSSTSSRYVSKVVPKLLCNKKKSLLRIGPSTHDSSLI
jgi:hypothetical protein